MKANSGIWFPLTLPLLRAVFLELLVFFSITKAILFAKLSGKGKIIHYVLLIYCSLLINILVSISSIR